MGFLAVRKNTRREGSQMKRPLAAIAWASSISMLIALAACGSDDSTPSGPNLPPSPRRQITIPGTALGGIFDPGPVGGSGSALWMNYSEVDAHPDDARLPIVSTRLAKPVETGFS
jgi:hypothetical protein